MPTWPSVEIVDRLRLTGRQLIFGWSAEAWVGHYRARRQAATWLGTSNHSDLSERRRRRLQPHGNGLIVFIAAAATYSWQRQDEQRQRTANSGQGQ